MKDLAIPLETISILAKDEKITEKQKRRERWIFVLLFGSLSGFLVWLTGLFIGALFFIGVIEKSSRINSLGTLLIVITFPLLMMSAHALDKIRELEKAQSKFIRK